MPKKKTTEQSLSMRDIIDSMMSIRKLKLKELAEAKGCSPSALHYAINKKSMGLETLQKIFKAMGEEVTFILKDGTKITLKQID